MTEGQEADPRTDDVEALARLVEKAVEIDGQVVQVSAERWAIHGHSTYDGEVILREYHDAETARWVVSHTPSPSEPADEPRHPRTRSQTPSDTGPCLDDSTPA